MADIGEQKVCQVLMFIGKLCERPIFDKQEQKCIFHSSNISLKKERFESDLEKYFSEVESNANEQYFDFSAFVFPGVSFDWRKFSKPAIFKGAQFHGFVRFFWTEFKNFVYFDDAQFQGALFSNTKFQLANFVKTKFRSGVDFSNAIFNDNANFTDSEFKIEERPSGSEKLLGQEGEKSESLNSIGNNKNISANFSEAEFHKEAYFTGAEFHYKVHFFGTSFLSDAVFLQTKFYVNANFFAVDFGGLTLFRGSSAHPLFYRGADFREISFRRDAIVKFQNVNLEETRFLNTNLEHINFSNVKWFCGSGLKYRRIALWDEFRPLSSEEKGFRRYESIAENYSQLVLNYERKRDYDSAEEFHIGEMEMRRMKIVAGLVAPAWFNKFSSIIGSKSSWFNFNWLRKGILWIKNKVSWLGKWINSYQLFKLVSSYGTSYWRALGVLVLFLFAFSWLFLYSGFQASETRIEGRHEVRVDTIEYNVLPDTEHSWVSIDQWFSDYLRAIQLTMSIITFQREQFYEPIGTLGRFLLFAAVIVLAAQAALLLLAIRRRFKR